jgi:TRAP-type C4-dicarboxylate transport system substrate-binding protein
MRTPPDPDRIELFHVWGAKPSPLDLNQLFDAFKADVFDGQENPVQNIEAQRLYEVQRYASMTGHIYSPAFVLASRQWWDSLDPRVQAMLRDTALATADNSRARGEEADRDAISRLSQRGMQVNTDVDKAMFQRAAAPVYAKFQKRLGSHLLELLEIVTGRSVAAPVDSD